MNRLLLVCSMCFFITLCTWQVNAAPAKLAGYIEPSIHSEAIQGTPKQLLLNLVRLKYRDTPLFTKRLLTPLNLDTIVLLIRSGWSIDRVLRLCVQQMNGLDNAARASAPTPVLAPLYAGFAEASQILHKLQLAGVLEIGYKHGDINAEVPELRVVPAVLEDSLWRKLVPMLGLKPSASVFDLTVGAMHQMRDAAGPGEREKITVTPRSLIGILFYLSHAIEVPRSHREGGLVTATHDFNDEPFDWSDVTGDLLRINSQENRPKQAAVAVKYRGHWFYIDDADLNSKSTFILLAQLFALQTKDVTG